MSPDAEYHRRSRADGPGAADAAPPLERPAPAAGRPAAALRRRRRRAVAASHAWTRSVAWRSFLLAYCLGLVPALVMALGQPIWSPVDEAQHADVLAQYAHGTYPVEGRTTLRPETVAVMRATGAYRWAAAGDQPAPEELDPARFTAPPGDLPERNREVWIERHLWWFSYEAMQPPLYYLLATPVWMAADQAAGPLAAVRTVRLVDALVLALLAPLALGASRLLTSARRVHWTSVALVALLPGLALNGTAVSNDGLAAVLGAAAVIVALRGALLGWSMRLAALAGLLVGGAILTKLNAAALVPLMALALTWPAAGAGPRRWRHLACAGLVAGALPAPWAAVNELLYRAPLAGGPARDLLHSSFPAFRLNRSYLEPSVRNGFVTFWTGEPHALLPYWRWEAELGALLTVVALLGLVRLLIATSPPPPARRALTLLAVAVLAGMASAAGSIALSGIGGLLPGRYLYPVLVPVAALLAIGLWQALTWVSGAALIGAYCALSIASVSAFAAGAAVPRDTRAIPPSTGARVSSAAQSRGVRIAIDSMAFQRTSDRLWLHVSAINASPGPADWWPIPVLQCGSSSEAADYRDSTPIPTRIPAGGSVQGWISFPPPPCLGVSQVAVVFPSVATDDYRQITDIPVHMTLNGSGPVLPADASDTPLTGRPDRPG